MARHKGITTKLRSSVYYGTSGRARGILVDTEISSWINNGIIPDSLYGRRLAAHIDEHMHLGSLKAQVFFFFIGGFYKYLVYNKIV